jgi:hypothetical protein
MGERIIRKINLKDFRVHPGEKIKLRERPTLVQPICPSKKRYPKTTAKRRRELKSIRKLLAT